ncbi:5-oxoprolinase subunit PxpB (plasmid) [Bradyrhizobium sp. 62B]|uniref:5-oxoprolinase subunit PxpB n=1 Tax=Bradyrhizobium sp. 62B TaxID=2898442 RepID=UPI002557E3D0|nr:5-oxoprolinase subunit PxpB [Bradyrhizobium sp. 62B]
MAPRAWTSEALLSINQLSAPFVGTIEESPKISLIGTLAMLVEAPGEFDLVQQGRIWALADAVSSWPNVQEAVVGVTNLMLVFDQPPADIGMLSASIVELWHRVPSRKADGKLIEIPVIYGGELGFDLPAVAKRAGLSEREVIRIHSEGEYTVCAVASSPGFGYLYGLDPRIHMPRKSVPSLNMRAGSVTIGGMQTGVAALTSPNGWNAIGWAPVAMFDPHGEQPSLMLPGDRVKFRIDRIEL